MSDIESRLYQACCGWPDGNKHLALDMISRLVATPEHKCLVRHDDWDSTPLHEACRHGWLDVVQDLVEKVNHDINVTDRFGLQSPLHISCQYGRVDIVIYLSKNGCNPMLRNSKGKEPIDYAIENDHIYTVLNLCKYCITSAMMLAPDRIITNLNLLNKVLQDMTRHFDWKTSNGDSIVEIVCHSKLIAKYMSPKKVLILVNHIQARIDDKSSDLIPHLICRDQSCVSCIPSVVMMEWLKDTRLDPMKLVISCNWKTVDGDTLLQLVCQTESCVSCISSVVMLKWLIDTTLDLPKLVPNYKTADGDTLLTLICQTESCISRISSTMFKTWLKQTNVDLLISGINWKTTDGNTVISIVHQLSEYGPSLMHIHLNTVPADIIITPHWESIDCKVSFSVFYRSKLYISQISSKELLKWLQKTNVDLEIIVSPNWKTADGDTLLQLVCQSETCVSRISSAVMMKWLNDTTHDVIKVMSPYYKTADGDSLLKLACQSEICVSFTTSAVIRKVLNVTTLDLEELIIPYYKTAYGITLLQLVCQYKSSVSRVSSAVMLQWLHETKIALRKLIVPNYKTADGDTLLQLVCQSESCVSRISAGTMEIWLRSTIIDLYMINIFDWKTTDSVTMIEVVCHLESKSLTFGTPLAVAIIPSWENVDGSTSLQILYFYDNESYMSQASSTDVFKWLQKTNLNLERIVTAVPNWKTADGDTLLQLVCRSESCVSRVSSKMLEYSLKSTNAELLVPSLNWKTADGVPINKIIQEVINSQRFLFDMVEDLSETLTDVVITPHWETDDGSTILQVLYQSELYISLLSSVSVSKWLQKTNIDVGKIVIPHWKTADGDTLLQLVCQSELCVSRISLTISPSDGLLDLVFHSEYLISQITSQVILNWLNSTKFTLVGTIISSWKTKNGDSIFKLLCTSHFCFSHISSSLMLQWLNDVDTARFNILKSVRPDWTTNDGYSILHLLCKSSMKENKVVELLQYYLQESILNPSLEDSDGNMALHLVCKADNSKRAIVSFFVSIDTKLDINDKNKEGLSPLEVTKDPETMEKLIQHGAKVTSDFVFNIILSVEEHKASKILLLSITKKTMLWKPTDVNDDGDTALHLACKADKPEVVKFLLTNMEWNLNVKNHNGLTPLELSKNLEIILCICQNDSVHIPSRVVKRWLNATFIDEEIVKIFNVLMCKHKLKTCDGSTILHVCCGSVKVFRDSNTLVNCLLNRHHDPNYLDENGQTPLQLTSDPQIMEKLVQHGAKVTSDVVFKIILNVEEHKATEILLLSITKKTMLLKPTDVNDDGDTALHLACKLNKPNVVKFLLTKNMWIINEKNSIGLSPLQLTSDLQIMEKLVQHGAKVTSDVVFKIILNVEDHKASEILLLSITKKTMLLKPTDMNDNGNTALRLACKVDKPDVVKCLLTNMEWNLNVRKYSGLSPLETTNNPENILDAVLEHKICDDSSFYGILNRLSKYNKCKCSVPKYSDKNGKTLLQLTSNPQIIEKLVQHGAKVTSDVVFKIILSVEEHKASEILLLSSTKRTMLLKPTDVNNDGDTALHLACKVDKADVVTFLLTNMHMQCILNDRNRTGLSPLELSKNPEIILNICQYDCVKVYSKVVKGWLNAVLILDEGEIVKIFELLIRKHKLKTYDGSTLLHLCCGRVNVTRDVKTLVNYLLNQHHDPNVLDKNEKTPLQLTSNPQIMEKLVQHGAKVKSDVVFKIILNVEEHKASEILLLSSKKKIMLWKPRDLNDDGDTALHLACRVDKPTVVKYLLKHGHCNATVKNLRNKLPIELTTNIGIVSLLLEHGATMTPKLVLKLIATESIPNDRLVQLLWNPNIANSDGNTALHLACQVDQEDTVNFLLSQTHCNPNVKNNNEEVPLQKTTNSDIIKDLIRYGARTSIMYESHKSALGTNEPIKPPVKMFVVGNPSVGKSTLTEALKKKLNFVARLFTSGKVSGVEKKTVGIIPHEIESDIFGRVTVYDFAGHREFYSGHAALLKAAIQSTPPVFLLVVNLLDRENEIIQNILYWISFLENQCTLVSCKPHLIIVGSHADTLKSKGVSPQEKVNTLVSLLGSNYFINLEFIGFISMDCQLHESAGMNDLRPLLVRSCSQLRIQEPITFNAHCFLVYLLETFKETPAVTISTIHEQIEKQLLSHREGVLDFLPKSTGALYKICVELNERGHILFLRGKKNLENSYVVIEEKSLLSEVSGTVFASEDFKQYKQLATTTGVVSLMKLAEYFPDKDLNILIGVLTHLEFCHEISNQALVQLISDKYSQVSDERYYLFPGLISIKAKESIWDTNTDFDYTFGWMLRCTKPEQFFSSRFIQVLLLRLAFSLAFDLKDLNDDPDTLAIHRKCSLWKNGIFWGTHFGMDTLVEIVDNKSVVVIVRFKSSHLSKCIEQRSQVLHTVLECVEEFCPRMSRAESFIETTSCSALKYPIHLNSWGSTCSISDLAEALVINCENPSVVLSESGKSVSAQSFVSFEPYAEIEASILQELWDNNNDNKAVPNAFVSRLIEKLSHDKIKLLIRVFNEAACVPVDSTCIKDYLFQKIVNWRDKSETELRTYKDLREKLNSHSVFAGRNILVSIHK